MLHTIFNTIMQRVRSMPVLSRMALRTLLFAVMTVAVFLLMQPIAISPRLDVQEAAEDAFAEVVKRHF